MDQEHRDLLIAIVAKFEGLYLRPYLDPVGIPTIGIGTIRYPDGRPVTLSDPPITKEQAYALAWHELADCIKAAVRSSPGLANDQRALVAIADFSYNLGGGAYRRSTLRRRINDNDRAGAKTEIVKWCKAGGRVLRGLLLRRQAESALI